MTNFYKNYHYPNYRPQRNYSYNNTNIQHNNQYKNTPPIFPSRNASTPNIPKSPLPPCKPPKKKGPPPKKKLTFKSIKKNTCTSLNDVECFLNNFSNFIKYVKLIHLLK